MLVAAIHLKIRDAKLTNQSAAGDERLAAPTDWLTDRYDTYHLRMWLIYDPTKNCSAPQDCNADVVRTAQRIDEGTQLWRKGILMTSAHEVLNAERPAARKQHPAHRKPSHDSLALCQIRTAQPPFRYGRYAVAFSRKVPVNAA
jgi:hypothetical protein